MKKDIERMLTDEELTMVSGGSFKECLSKSDVKKLCNRIRDLHVDVDAKISAIAYIDSTGGNFELILAYLMPLSRKGPREWKEVFDYFVELARC